MCLFLCPALFLASLDLAHCGLRSGLWCVVQLGMRLATLTTSTCTWRRGARPRWSKYLCIAPTTMAARGESGLLSKFQWRCAVWANITRAGFPRLVRIASGARPAPIVRTAAPRPSVVCVRAARIPALVPRPARLVRSGRTRWGWAPRRPPPACRALRVRGPG